MPLNSAETYNAIVKAFFQEHFPSFTLLNETAHGPYWGVRYRDTDLEIHIEGDIGFSIDIYLNDKKYFLGQYNNRIADMAKTTPENIIAQLHILKEFLH